MQQEIVKCLPNIIKQAFEDFKVQLPAVLNEQIDKEHQFKSFADIIKEQKEELQRVDEKITNCEENSAPILKHLESKIRRGKNQNKNLIIYGLPESEAAKAENRLEEDFKNQRTTSK